MLFCVCIPENLYFNYIIRERWIDINGTSPYSTTSITSLDPWGRGGGVRFGPPGSLFRLDDGSIQAASIDGWMDIRWMNE